MRFSHKCVPELLRTYQALLSSLKETTSSLVFHKSQPVLFECKKHFSNSAVSLKNDSKIPSLSKYELFSEKTVPDILDVEEERQKELSDEKILDEFEGINLNRGVTGVFDVEELVELLQKEKGEEIFVVKIPSEFNYADYIVIVSGRSTRHMQAMSSLIRKIYKKKIDRNDHIPRLEGKNSSIWMALDLGNIVLHVFSKEGRKAFDLETLWSVGKDYDSLSQKKGAVSEDLLTSYTKILASLSPK